MIRTEVSDSIPIDLIIEILSRLPAKSILKFRCVSKLWGFMLLRPYFTELFRTRSSARLPRLLFTVKRVEDCCFFTSPQPQNPYEEKSLSSLVVSADFHMKFPGDTWPDFCDLVAGLIYFRPTSSYENEAVICNPSTVQYASLRLPFHCLSLKKMMSRSFLGFDPIDKQFKVLYLTLPLCEKLEPDEILTLGTGNDSWREIHCPLNHYPSGEGICINGFLYYLALRADSLPSMIVCFDVRSETFKFIHKDFICLHYFSKLVNYKGKLGVITLDNRINPIKLCMYLIKDVENPELSEWSEYFCYCWEDDKVLDNSYLTIVGVTAATGEIVLSMKHAFIPFYVFFLNIERSTLQCVEIQGLGATHVDNGSKVKVFLDHVEDLNFINMKTKYDATTTSTSSTAHVQQDRFESINKFDSLRLF